MYNPRKEIKQENIELMMRTIMSKAVQATEFMLMTTILIKNGSIMRNNQATRFILHYVPEGDLNPFSGFQPVPDGNYEFTKIILPSGTEVHKNYMRSELD